ncbi:MAG TPA: hypothetical protein VNM72_13675 [Blastocatellia bacterium]|nr:hypothetical protein [Blastocatellia bacterium]
MSAVTADVSRPDPARGFLAKLRSLTRLFFVTSLTEKTADSPTKENAQTAPELSPEREQLRLRHGVRLVTPEEEGTGMDRLPPGVYGFTYTPTQWDGPLFRTKKYLTFEVHKCPQGDDYLIAYASEEDARRINDPGRVTITVSPDPEPGSSVLVVVPLDRVNGAINISKPMQGKFLPLHLEPLE